MSGVGLLTRVPGRWLVPLLMVVLALGGAALNYRLQVGSVAARVAEQEVRVLRERLTVEQTRLDLETAAGDAQLLHRLVGSLALHDGLDHAFLISPQGRVEASLSRLHIGRAFAELTGEWPALLREMLAQSQARGVRVIEVHALPGADRLAAFVPVQDGRWLVVSEDMALPLAQHMVVVRKEVLREAMLLLGAAAVLAVLLHLIWFRRARQLGLTLAAIGRGRLHARSGLEGRDELALIGAEIDQMAGQLQADQTEIRHLNDVVNRSPVVVIEWRNEPGWPVAFVNEAVSQWGYQKEDWLAGRWDYSELIHADDAQRVHDEVAGYFANGPDEYQQEYRLRCADGRWIWVDDRTALTRGEDGAVLGITGILVDITARKEAQAAAREQADLVRMFYEMPFIGMAISSPANKRWLQVNDRLCEILGYSRDTLLQKTWAEMTPEPDLQRNLVLFEDLVAGRRDSYQMEKTFRRADGSTVHTAIHVRSVHHADGSLRHLFTTVQDVTERVLADAALREQNERLERAEAMAGLGSWSYDPASLRGWWSEQMFRNLGLEPIEGVPAFKEYVELLHPEDRDQVRVALTDMMAGERMPAIDYRTDPARGPVRWLRATSQRHERAGGLPPHYTGTVQDVTTEKEAEEALKRTNEALEQRVQERTRQLSDANHELEAFTYTVSHDLRAPLRGIDGYSQLLQEDYGPQLDDAGRSFVDRIRRGVLLMSQLISDLLDYSHLERRSMGHEAVDVPPLVELVLEGFSADLERHGTAVDRQLEAITLRVDRDALALALRNLIGNAIKFSSASPQPMLQIGARTAEGHHTLWVRDNGVGFDMNYHDRIFGIFQRLHRAEEYPGTGVGLALVTKAVQRMGGRVWAESTPGKGATFYLEFPA
ncbi:MAG: PAS domain S-box protein [Hydrogenophaga sp.]|nr:PAS domain S-box protein [Hydrogenophaga sp.]